MEVVDGHDTSTYRAAYTGKFRRQDRRAVRQGKAELPMKRAEKILKERGWTQAKAASVLGIKQPHVSAWSFLTDLGHDIEITLRPTRRQHGKLSVVVAA
jgi:hypothetical protein